jgi:hypothetical protein
MTLSPTAWLWLAGSILGALAVDWAALRLLLEVLRPPSGYVFWAGRLAKLVAVFAWCLFFNTYWYPQYLSAGLPPSSMVYAAEGALLAGLLLLGFATLPRIERGR